MKRFEYFQETVESIMDDSWFATLDRHGNQGWELCTITVQNVYKKQKERSAGEPGKEEPADMQTFYIITYRRDL